MAEAFIEDSVATPIGPLVMVSAGDQLCAVEFASARARIGPSLRRRFGTDRVTAGAVPAALGQAFHAYFAGDLTALDRLSCLTRGTAFQEQVWSRLRLIPPGATMSYGEMAQKLGKPRGARAVGAANAINPFAIVVPCHRLRGHDGKLTGYAGGLSRKAWLLDHEQRHATER